MAQKTVDVEVSAIYSFTYDPDSPEFKETLDNYRKVIDKGGNEENVLVHVAHNLRRSGTAKSMFEEQPAPGEILTGIRVEDLYPDYNYEIL